MDHNQRLVAALRRKLQRTSWADTPPMDAWAFLVTEIGEVGDLLLRLGYGTRDDYTRNNPMGEHEAAEALWHELGDVMIMLCTLANHVGVDLTVALGQRVRCYERKYGDELAA